MSQSSGVDGSVSKSKDGSVSKSEDRSVFKSKDGSGSFPGPSKDKRTALLLDKVKLYYKNKEVF